MITFITTVSGWRAMKASMMTISRDKSHMTPFSERERRTRRKKIHRNCASSLTLASAVTWYPQPRWKVYVLNVIDGSLQRLIEPFVWLNQRVQNCCRHEIGKQEISGKKTRKYLRLTNFDLCINRKSCRSLCIELVKLRFIFCGYHLAK